MKTKKQLKPLVDPNFKSIRIKINDIHCYLYYLEDTGILTTKIVSEFNSLIYKSKINSQNILIDEEYSQAYILDNEIFKLRNMVEQIIIENI
jgi:hypothetical protein